MAMAMAISACGVTLAQTPVAPTPQPGAATTTFPEPNPKNFTVASPSRDEVNDFLKALWGYDENRIWSVAAVLKTTAPGVAKVVVLVGDKSQPGKVQQSDFYTLPDGKHAFAGQVVEFGSKPWADNRKVLMEQATGPARGAKSKELELVEFADLQCPHCKDAQDTMNNLASDFPQAHIVFENLPLEIHPYAFRAAAEGLCVRKAKGDEAFFTYANTVFTKQDSLTPQLVDQTLATAVAAAGGDPVAAAACAKTPEIAAEIKASTKLSDDLGVDQTPMLAVNGHLLPVTAIPYETLKRMIVWQAKQDGIDLPLQPSLSTLK
ncbi:Protein-disulfide isomerase [Bryocella elongata]|uniref:Protein-disulfide isomerase n=2 Tax=Bryocella elongata TaxID=863522 RepID=A0A1H5T286_9BACT|nr:Protein-disulfide isomerase [Bryocella elongata]